MNATLLFLLGAVPLCTAGAVSVPAQVLGASQGFKIHSQGALFHGQNVLLSTQVSIPLSSYDPLNDYFYRVQTQQEFPLHYVVNETDEALTIILESEQACENLQTLVGAQTTVQLNPQFLQLSKGKKIRSPGNSNTVIVEYEDRQICPLSQASVYDKESKKVGSVIIPPTSQSLTFIIRKKLVASSRETSNSYTIIVYKTADMAQILTQ